MSMMCAFAGGQLFFLQCILTVVCIDDIYQSLHSFSSVSFMYWQLAAWGMGDSRSPLSIRCQHLSLLKSAVYSISPGSGIIEGKITSMYNQHKARNRLVPDYINRGSKYLKTELSAVRSFCLSPFFFSKKNLLRGRNNF